MNVRSLKISERQELFLSLIVITIIALAIRLALMPFESGDVRVFMSWLINIKTLGIIEVLNQSGIYFSYNPAFMYLLSIASLLPSWVPEVVAVKAISIPFEILSAFLSAKIIKKLGYGDKIALIGYALVLLTPTVLLDGAAWGQCDAIFTSFIILSVYFLCEERPFWSMVAFAISLSFKLQSMLFAPAILCFFIAGKIRFRDFFIVPIVFLVMLLPSVIAGRDIFSLLTIYQGQAEIFRYITLNAPNIYVWFVDGDLYQWRPDSLFFILKPLAYLLTITFVLFMTSAVRYSKIKIKPNEIILISFVSTLVAPYFLPMMHERYFYIADILSVLFVFSVPKMFYIPVLLQAASICTYLSFLMPTNPKSYEYLLNRVQVASVVVTFVVVLMIREFYLRLYKTPLSANEEYFESEKPNSILSSKSVIFSVSGCFILFLIWISFSYHPRIIASRLYLPITKDPIVRSDGFVDVPFLGKERASSYTQGWAIPYFDADLRGYPLIVNTRQSRNSLCVHATSTITYDLQQNYSQLSGSVGFPDYLDRNTAPTSVTHEIIGDEKVLWSSQVLKPGTPAEDFKIDISNIKQLVLKVGDAGNGINFDHTCWVNISLQP